MIGGEHADGDAPRSGLRHARAGHRVYRRAPRGARPRRHGRTGLLSVRAERRGPLRQDGAQRYRVRSHGGVRGGLRHSAARQRGPAPARPTPRPRRFAIRSTTSTTSTCADIAEVWRRGSVIASWLLDLTASALAEDPEFKSFSGRVSDSARDDGRSGRDRRRRAGSRSWHGAQEPLQLAGAAPKSRTSCSPRRATHSGAMSSSVREAHHGAH